MVMPVFVFVPLIMVASCLVAKPPIFSSTFRKVFLPLLIAIAFSSNIVCPKFPCCYLVFSSINPFQKPCYQVCRIMNTICSFLFSDMTKFLTANCRISRDCRIMLQDVLDLQSFQTRLATQVIWLVLLPFIFQSPFF